MRGVPLPRLTEQGSGENALTDIGPVETAPEAPLREVGPTRDGPDDTPGQRDQPERGQVCRLRRGSRLLVHELRRQVPPLTVVTETRPLSCPDRTLPVLPPCESDFPDSLGLTRLGRSLLT